MKRQVVKIINKGIYKVIHDDIAKYNPYTVYRVANGHQTKLTALEDLTICLYFLSEVISDRNSAYGYKAN